MKTHIAISLLSVGLLATGVGACNRDDAGSPSATAATNPAAESPVRTYDPKRGTLDAMIASLKKAGYQGAFRADGRPAR